MTKLDWLVARDVDPLLSELRLQGMPLRQFRLWGCGVARRLAWNHLVDAASTHAIEVAETYADGRGDEATLSLAHDEARNVYAGVSLVETVANSGWAASRLAAVLTRPDLEFNTSTVTILSRVSHAPWLSATAQEHGGWAHRGDPLRRTEANVVQLAVLREIVGLNPFQPWCIPHEVRAWRDGLVTAMAEGILAGRDWDQLPVLADALEDAGCGTMELLEHLRSVGPHHVGCWALDAILERPRWQPQTKC